MHVVWTLLSLQIIVFTFFSACELQEYGVLTESRIPLKLVLGGVRIVALSISSHEQNN